MSRSGIDHPKTLDLVTEGSDAIRLILVESRALVESDAPALQEKLNSYLSYALGGGLLAQYPNAAGKHTCIRIDLYAQPDRFILEFVHAYSAALIQHGVSLEVSVDGKSLL